MYSLSGMLKSMNMNCIMSSSQPPGFSAIAFLAEVPGRRGGGHAVGWRGYLWHGNNYIDFCMHLVQP